MDNRRCGGGNNDNAQWRLALLERAEKLGNVSQACAEYGVSRTRFYHYRRRLAQEGVAGLEDRPPLHKSHPQTTPPDVVNELVELATRYPASSGQDLAARLSSSKTRDAAPFAVPSTTTVCKILKARNLGRAERQRAHSARWPSNNTRSPLPFERTVFEEAPQLQIDGGPQLPSPRPGYRLCQFIAWAQECDSIGAVYVCAVVDTYTSRVWASLHIRKSSEDAIALLRDQVLPFWSNLRLLPHIIETPHNRLFCKAEPTLQQREFESEKARLRAQGRGDFTYYDLKPNAIFRRSSRSLEDEEGDSAGMRAYKAQARADRLLRKQQMEAVDWRRYAKYLAGLGVDHRTSTGRGATFNDFAHRFYHSLRSEFFVPQRCQGSGMSLEQLQRELGVWTRFYNEERPNRGYPNDGCPPAACVTDYLESGN